MLYRSNLQALLPKSLFSEEFSYEISNFMKRYITTPNSIINLPLTEVSATTKYGSWVIICTSSFATMGRLSRQIIPDVFSPIDSQWFCSLDGQTLSHVLVHIHKHLATSPHTQTSAVVYHIFSGDRRLQHSTMPWSLDCTTSWLRLGNTGHRAQTEQTRLSTWIVPV